MEKRKAYRILKDIYLYRSENTNKLYWIIGNDDPANTIGAGSIMLFSHMHNKCFNFVCIDIKGKQLGVNHPEFNEKDINNLLHIEAIKEI